MPFVIFPGQRARFSSGGSQPAGEGKVERDADNDIEGERDGQSRGQVDGRIGCRQGHAHGSRAAGQGFGGNGRSYGAGGAENIVRAAGCRGSACREGGASQSLPGCAVSSFASPARGPLHGGWVVGLGARGWQGHLTVAVDSRRLGCEGTAETGAGEVE